ncbi:MAG: glycerol acyltransferase [Rikenellaceae bacterium]|nr:glycerol acyltransferase [Rikenellaceae bacterium]MDE7355735.1 glycerol acyltransferase [Rikenellaceae bacterium]
MKIDLSKVIRDKNERLYRRLPGFVIKALARIIHEDEINDVLTRFGHLDGVAFVTAVLDDFAISRSWSGLDDIPDGRYIFAANHPLGGLDAFVLAEAVARRFGDVRLVVNDVLMKLDPLRSIFTPVNKYGSQNQDYYRMYNELFASDLPVIYFPAGLCSRRIGGVISDVDWKKNFVQKAVDSGRDIVPAFVDAVNSPRFYRAASLRKKLGIGVNLELVLLPGELFAKRGATINLRFGKPVPHSVLRGGRHAAVEAAELKKMCYDL